jgi:hypothetical protein
MIDGFALFHRFIDAIPATATKHHILPGYFKPPNGLTYVTGDVTERVQIDRQRSALSGLCSTVSLTTASDVTHTDQSVSGWRYSIPCMFD